jgi:hypothetical protein
MEKDAMISVTIELPEEQSAALAAKAQAKGLSAEEYVRKLLELDLVPDWLQESWSTSQQIGLDRLSPEEIDAEIAVARKKRNKTRSQPGA